MGQWLVWVTPSAGLSSARRWLSYASRTSATGPVSVKRLDRAWDMVEARLGQSPYLAGADFTAADIMTLFPLTTMRLFAPRELGGYPNIAAYLQRIGGREAFQRAMTRADPGFVVPLT